MLRIVPFFLAFVVAEATTNAYAQEDQQPQERSEPADSPAPVAVPRVAVPRSEAPARVGRPAPPEPVRSAPAPEANRREAPEPARREAPPAAAPVTSQEQGRAVPRGSRPRGDNPPVGVAVPRTRQAPPPVVVDRGGRDRDRNIIVTRPPVYNNYYYYPRSYYPYGYGAFGLGYFYYDPYRWYSPSYGYRDRYYSGGFYGNVWRSGRYFDTVFDIGELRLRVTPRNAQVFIDGYYAGVVDDYDGTFQSLRMESGGYRVELIAPGYEPLEFNVRIMPGEKITYRGDLRRLP